MISYLSKDDQLKADRLKELYHKAQLDKIKCSDYTNKEFYRGKAFAINEVSILFYNIDISDK